MFKNTEELIFKGLEQRQSKAGQPYTLALFGNPIAMESFDLFVGDNVAIQAQSGQKVTIVIDLVKRGYNVEPVLKSVVAIETK